MDEYRRRNREHWDELAALHPTTDEYDVARVLDGGSSLGWLEREELGDVDGAELLHLQCHFGLDTLSWLREGASDVVGVDFSPVAVDAARGLAAEMGVESRARFVESDVLELATNLDEQGSFDVVFTSYGVLTWLPDIGAWAETVERFLAPGGTFYIAEIHPVSEVLMDLHVEDGVPQSDYSYFGDGVRTYDEEGSYADRGASVENTTTHYWAHGLGDVVTALLDAGLRLDFLHEHPFACYRQFPWLTERDDGYYEGPGDEFPLTFSIRATKPT